MVKTPWLPVCALLVSASVQASESSAGIFDTLLKDGELDLSSRYRYEFVDQDCCDPSQPAGIDFDDDAHASTARRKPRAGASAAL